MNFSLPSDIAIIESGGYITGYGLSQKWGRTGLALHFQWHLPNSTFNSLPFFPLYLFLGCTFQEETFSIRCPKHKVSRWIGFTCSKEHLWYKRHPHYTMNFSVLVTFHHHPNNSEEWNLTAEHSSSSAPSLRATDEPWAYLTLICLLLTGQFSTDRRS